MDRHMRESLDRWLTTSPEEFMPDDYLPLEEAEAYALKKSRVNSEEYHMLKEAFLAGAKWAEETP